MNGDSSWDTWFGSWQLTLEAKGRRPRTIEFYHRELLRFGERVGVGPLDVTRAIVRDWVRSQIAEDRAANTIQNRLIVVKSFYSWLVDEGELPASPAAGVSSPRHRGPDPAVLTDGEVDRVLATLPVSSRDPLVRRNRAIVLVLESSGCRSAELLSMRDAGVDLRGRRIEVEGKGGTWRAVPISAQAAEAVDRYRRVRSQLRGSHGLWWSREGNLTKGGLSNMLSKVGKEAGVNCHPHRWRHRFAHRWLDQGGSEAGLQVAAGWSSVVMPRRYGRSMATDRMLAEHDRLFGR